MENKTDRLSEWNERTEIDGDRLESVLDHIGTLAETHGLTDREEDVAKVIARRDMKEKQDTESPRAIARDAVTRAPERA